MRNALRRGLLLRLLFVGPWAVRSDFAWHLARELLVTLCLLAAGAARRTVLLLVFCPVRWDLRTAAITREVLTAGRLVLDMSEGNYMSDL